jgi:ketosteroid isomerase-like protein
MNTWNTSLSTIAVVIAFAGPAFAQNAKSIAEQGNQKWIQAYAAGDAAALTPLYARDAVLLPQGVAERLIGEANIRKFYEDSVKQRLTNVSFPVTEARPRVGIARVRTFCRYSAAPILMLLLSGVSRS